MLGFHFPFLGREYIWICSWTYIIKSMYNPCDAAKKGTRRNAIQKGSALSPYPSPSKLLFAHNDERPAREALDWSGYHLLARRDPDPFYEEEQEEREITLSR